MAIGLTVPLQISTGSVGYFRVTQDEFEAIKQNLHSLLITNWGERVVHYNFGCNLREFVFEPQKSEDLKLAIADRINAQVALWMPYIALDKLNILFAADNGKIPENGIGVLMSYILRSKPDFKQTESFIIKS